MRQFLNINRTPHWVRENQNNGPFFGQPEQVHLSMGGGLSEFVVTWITFDDILFPTVELGDTPEDLKTIIKGKSSLFLDGSKNGKKRYVHRAVIVNIEPGKRYYYHVGSKYGWSPVFWLKGLKERPDGGYKFAVFGDMGNINARSLGKLQSMAQQHEYDMVLHVGDFAYNMDTDDGKFGDEFFRQIEPIAAYIPYMVVPGNHESAYNFSHYKNRFTMPDTEDNLFYSFDIGAAHIIGFSTEVYFYTSYGWNQIANQWNWLVNDLHEANKKRHQRPFVITMGHRPMYCSTFDTDDCSRYQSIIRTGLPITHAYGLEKLFYENQVDVELWAHEHTFERLYPVYNRTAYNKGTDPYYDPKAPVHFISGSAGCQEDTDTFISDPGPWSAFRSSDYGFSMMQVYNHTHLRFQQISAAEDKIIDDVWVVKTHKNGYHRKGALNSLLNNGEHFDLNHKTQYQKDISDL
uniref:Purple acid phosphatase n=1 Tax=Rhabditophanes sp. KR3021 TaxID=114890 RepID=A0AC35TSV8_9BILA